jgi:S-adenosylmethionine-diacylgycerolhomoserine-N-methlytransferase
MSIYDPSPEQNKRMQAFYRRQAYFYEATRWAFLFGRNRLLQYLELPAQNRLHLLEVGCGTGHNLKNLEAQYPKMHLTGVDVSDDMLIISNRRIGKKKGKVQLHKIDYAAGQAPLWEEAPDVVLFSYVLTMMNPGWEAAIESAIADLPPGGRIAVVDFHDSRIGWFKKWMHLNHVRMDAHLLPFLEGHFEPVVSQKKAAYAGLWQYFLFVGEKRREN